MNTIVERQIDPTTGSLGAAASSWKRRIRAGEVEQRFPRDRSKKAVTVERRARPIRAWHAPEAGALRADRAEPVDNPAAGHPFVRQALVDSRRSAAKRVARIRAVEAAWKQEKARQVEVEAEERRRAEMASSAAHGVQCPNGWAPA